MNYFSTLKDPGSGAIYSYDNVWDAQSMYGCNCDRGYFGPDCSLKHCPTGDDPFTGTALVPAKQQFNEKQQVRSGGHDGITSPAAFVSAY
jgi:hypothetical protein